MAEPTKNTSTDALDEQPTAPQGNPDIETHRLRVCATHGSYPAEDGECPLCAGKAALPQALTYVEWLDSYGPTARWEHMADIELSPLTCHSIGWIVKETEEALAIAGHVTSGNHEHTDPQCCGLMVIPKCAIVRRREMASPDG